MDMRPKVVPLSMKSKAWTLIAGEVNTRRAHPRSIECFVC